MRSSTTSFTFWAACAFAETGSTEGEEEAED
ncbi:hypothetical protein FB387_006441 [Streptomyces cinereoruber]|nr:hypothetical protein [Streptomyces cinereoruber]NIH65207.1 hypothetical protein [Streptomyces cinereoruber]